MSGFIEDDEESGIEWWGIKFPRTLEVRKSLRMVQETFPHLWAMMLQEIASGGLDVDDEITLTPRMALDSINAGLICPVYKVDAITEVEMITFTFWSPFGHSYIESYELDEFELDWLVAALNIIWSVN